MKKITVFIISLLLVSLSIYAAGSSENSDVIHLVWWHSNSGVLGEATDALVEEFNKTTGAETGIEVEAVYQGSADTCQDGSADRQHRRPAGSCAARCHRRR